MDAPRHVLLMTNATTDGEVILIKEAINQSVLQGLKIKLSLVHVIPSLPTCYFNIPSMVALAEQYYEEAQFALTSTGAKLSVSKKDQWLITGRIKTEVLRLAKKLNTDFILASSTSVSELHKPFFFKKVSSDAIVKSIGSLVHI